MSVKTFYNSNIHLTIAVGSLSVLSPALAFAAPKSDPQTPPLTTEQKTSESSYLLPNSALVMTRPAQVPEAGRNPSFTDVLSRAFTRDDLNQLYGAGGFSQCETSSRIPSFFEKNYSNFAASCLEQFRSRQAISFDERFRANPESEGVAVSPLGGRIQWTNISAGARERLLKRSVQELANKNKTLGDILQGRISFDFGLTQIFSKNSSQIVQAPPPRPRYVVEVIDPTPVRKQKNRSLVASIGRLPNGSLSKEGLWFTQRPTRARRTLKETFEPAPATTAQTVESIIPANVGDAKDTESSLRYVSRLAGLSALPFSKINMRAERRLVDGQNSFALRAMESQELFYAEIPDVRRPKADALVWGYKIPWQRHALAVRIDEGAEEKVTSYSFKIDDSNKSEFNYNHKSNAISAGFVMSL